jgi:N-methylhydantoinase A/oxoprolinase/acetone carboxylase beta subunit
VSSRIGVDTGGTFTDFVRLDSGRIRVYKARTTGQDPASGVIAGLDEIAGDAPDAPVGYGTTVATNAVLERKGARVALIVTRGFEDVPAIGRQTRPELYSLQMKPRRALVEARLTFGLGGRLDADGVELEPIDQEALAALVRRVARSGAEVVAVCLLHSYASPRHEAQVVRALGAVDVPACASHDVLPEYREYERWSTTVVNAYVAPLMDRHLGRLERALGSRRLSVMQSNGGSISAGVARTHPVRTVLSGPAAGVVGARAVAAAAGFDRVISFDAGGTSTDVCLIDESAPIANEASLGDIPVRLPVIDVHTVGAGGGSIARIDGGGALVVGPESAGAVPGPACYGVGSELTVTDAHVLLGRLDPEFFLAGRMAIDPARARAVAGGLARQLKRSIEGLAEGVIRVANARMQRAIRVVSLERGHDPRRFVLVAFGGAGGMHAADLATELGIGTVLVPRHAGVLSAVGMLLADVTRDYSRSVLRLAASTTAAELDRRFGPVVRRARQDLAAEGFRAPVISRQVDVRYAGQSYEISVPWSTSYAGLFHELHRRRYGYADARRPIEVVALRVRAVGITKKPVLAFAKPRRSGRPTPIAVRSSRFDGRSYPTGFYRWDDLRPGHRAPGPAIIWGGEATVVVPPAFGFAIDGFGNVLLARRR